VCEESTVERARRLRQDGWSLRRIAAHLGIALSTASVWTRGARKQEEPVKEASIAPTAPMDEPTRWCSRCSRARPESVFNRHPSGRQWWCRDCFKRYYAEQATRHRARNNALKTARVQQAHAFVLGHLRAHACSDCGEGDPVVLEFDHIGTKGADISTLIRRGVQLSRIEAEIARCEVVCVNCHRRRTARRGRWRRADASRTWRSVAHERNVRCATEHLALSGCADCGEPDPQVLDFDHVGTKTGNVMRLARNEVSLDRLREEIARCVVRCANCHRRRTASVGGYYRARAGSVPPARVELALPD
jgi:hypothetical protein